MTEIEFGTRVCLTRDVERYPHFIAEEGRTGTVVTMDDELIAVRLEEELDGAEEWDNEIHWHPGLFEDSSFQAEFRRDVEPVS